jgi:Zn-dependent protease
VKPHFRLFGIPVRVDATFAFLTLILGYLLFLDGRGSETASSRVDDGLALFLAWIPIVTGAVLVHELGHALVGRAFGLAPAITLHGMGGVTLFDARAHRALSHGRRILITLAGPLAGIVVGAIALGVQLVLRPLPGSVASEALWAIQFTTLGWGVLNLFPMLPLDGGHIVATVLEKIFGIRGVLFARIASIVIALALAALILASWTELATPWFGLAVLASLTINNWRSYQLEKAWQTEAPLQPILQRAFAALEAGRTAEVRELAEVIRSTATSPGMKGRASHLLGWAHLLEGDAERARLALAAAPPGYRHDALLEGRVLLACGRASEAISPLLEALVDRGDEEIADSVAEAFARAGRVDEFVALLESRERSERAGHAVLRRIAGELASRGNDELASIAYERLFARFRDPRDAFDGACALARLDERGRALALLGQALDAGLTDLRLLDVHADLAPLRGTPEMDALRARAGL